MSQNSQLAVVVLGRNDNVAVAARPLPKGFLIEHATLEKPVEVRQVITLGHKVATRAIAQGEPVLKYGQIIGFASKAISPGEWVHVHNISADA